MISHERLTEVLTYDPETGVFMWKRSLANRRKVGSVAGYISKQNQEKGRVCIRIDNVLYLAHRLAWLYMTGKWPKDEIDHKNLNQSDNSFANLREATRADNSHNVHAYKNNVSGFKGVYFDRSRKKWAAQIKLFNKNRRLGRFPSSEEAYLAYCKAATELHGSFARTK